MVDTVVTNVSYDPEAANMELRFTPLRGLNDDEYSLVVQSQAQPEATNYTKITLFEKKGAEATAEAEPEPAAKPVVKSYAEPDDDEEVVAEVAEPTKRASTKQQTTERPDPASLAAKVSDLWGDE
jgi:hypothetical protein